MSTEKQAPDPRITVVTTGWPLTSLIACTECGVLLWDTEKHYREIHPTYIKPGVVT